MVATPSQISLYFAPDQDCLTPLLEVIRSASERLVIADYSFNSPQVTDCIIAKYHSGIPVTLLLDKSQSKGKTEIPQLVRLQNGQVPMTIGDSDKHKIMHLKVAIADDTIAFGSYNFTTTAALENNVLAVYESAGDAATFVDQINKAISFIQSQNAMLRVERNSTMDYRDVAVRAAKTFAQAFLAALALSALDWLRAPSYSVAEKLLLAAAIAGASAAWNLVLVPAWDASKVKLASLANK